MQTQLLYINDQVVDLTDEPLAYTLNINDLGNLKSQQANYTKQFKLILTQKNRFILGFPDDITFNTGSVYKKLPAQYVVNGIQIIPNGFIEIQSVQNNIANVILLAGNADFLDRLGYQIYDMGDSTSPATNFGRNKVWDAYNNCVWNVANAAGSQQNTDGFIWSVIDWGQMGFPDYTEPLNVLGMRPCFFLHTAIELLVKSTGYRINKSKSCLYNDPVFSSLYKKILIPFSSNEFSHGTDYQNTHDGAGPTYTTFIDTIIHHARTGHDSDQVGTIIFDKGTAYAPGVRQRFTATFAFDFYMRGIRGTTYPAGVAVNFIVKNPDGSTFIADSYNFQLDDQSTILDARSFIAEEKFNNNQLSFDFDFTPGMELSIGYSFNHVGTSPQDTYAIIYKGATLFIELNEKDVLYGQKIECERILPNIGQIDFLQDTLQAFGLILIANPNDQTIIFTSFKTLVKNIAIANDWSNKVVDMGKEIDFQIPKLSQVNFLRYTQDDSIKTSLMPKYFADDHFEINDKTLNPNQVQQDLFVRPWAPTRNRPYYGGTTAEILMIDRATEGVNFSIGIQPRLLIDQKIDLRKVGVGGAAGGPTVTFTNGSDNTENITINDWLSVPYFYKPDAPELGDDPLKPSGAAKHLAWKSMPGYGTGVNGKALMLPGLRSVYYSEFEHILKETKIVTRYFILTPADIANFDFLIPIYLRQDNAYFYCNQIQNWVKGYPTKVELIRL